MTTTRQDATDRHRRGSIAARAAGIAFAPLPLIPFSYAVAALLDTRPPDPGCVESCDHGRDFAWYPLVLGVIGVWMAILIWRRHVAAMGLALFVTALLTLLWGIGFGALVFAGGSLTSVNPWLIVIGFALLAIDGLLAAALREEMTRAGAQAATGTTVTESGGSPPG